MQKLKTFGFFAAWVAAVAVIIFGIFVFSDNFMGSRSEKESAATECQGSHQNHKITIRDDKATPKHVEGSLCDTLTVTNEDDRIRLMAFGKHDDHVAYDGVSEKYVKKGQSFTVTLVKPGTYIVHDHLQEDAGGTFTVTK
jgi:plastocyanin